MRNREKEQFIDERQQIDYAQNNRMGSVGRMEPLPPFRSLAQLFLIGSGRDGRTNLKLITRVA